MLQINLLPVRLMKKRMQAQKELAMMGTALAAFCLLLAGVWFWQSSVVASLEEKRQTLQRKKDELAPLLAELKKLKKKKIELQRKASIIKKLRKESPLTVRILDEVANNTDNQRMWLTSLEQQGGHLTLTGVALDNHTIAQYMDNLKASRFVVDVALGDSSLKEVAGRNLKKFTLNCTIAYPAEKREEGEKKETP